MALFRPLVSSNDLPDEIVLREHVNEKRLKQALSLRDNEEFKNVSRLFCSMEEEGFRSFGNDCFSRNRIYKLNEKEGRYYCASQFVKSKIRDWLLGFSSCLDIKNCFFSLLYGYLERFFKDELHQFPVISKYALCREEVYSLFGLQMQLVDQEIPDDFSLKKCFLSLLNGKTLYNLKRDLGFSDMDYVKVPAVLKDMSAEVDKLVVLLENVEGYADMYYLSEIQDINKQRFQALRRFLNVLESLHVLLLIDVLKNIADVTLWVHDAIEIMGFYEGDEETCDLLRGIRYTLQGLGFYNSVKLVFKNKEEGNKFCESFFSNNSTAETEGAIVYNNIPLKKSSFLSHFEDFFSYEDVKAVLENDFTLFRCSATNMVYWKYPGTRNHISQKLGEFVQAFSALQYEERIVKPPTKRCPDGEEIIKKKPFAKMWLLDNSASCYLNAGYFPDGKTPFMYKNLFEGLEISFIPLLEQERENPYYLSEKKFFFDHVKFLCDNDDAAYNWIVMFIAHMFKYPAVIPRVMLFLCSRKQGTGKTLLILILMEMIGSEYSLFTGDSDNVVGKFNGMIEGKLLISVDEGKFEKKEQTRMLKSLITGEITSVQSKGIMPHTVSSYARHICATNEEEPVKLSEEEEDRRYFIVQCTGSKLEDSYGKRLSNIRRNKKILRLIYEEFMNNPVPADYDFSGNRPRSKMYEDVLKLGRSPEIESLVDYIQNMINEHFVFGKQASYETDTKVMYTYYKNYFTQFQAGLSQYMKGLKAYTKICREWLSYQTNAEVAHGITHRVSNGSCLIKFKFDLFNQWFENKANFKLGV